MKDTNLFTKLLFLFGQYALAGSLLHFSDIKWSFFIVAVAVTVCLDLFPIKLPNGSTFGTNSVIYIFVLLSCGMTSTVILMTISLVVIHRQASGALRNINWFRYFSTLGMYFLGVLSAKVFFKLTPDLISYIQGFFGVFLFELVNSVLLGIIKSTITKKPIWPILYPNLKHTIIPAFICSMTATQISYLYECENYGTELIITGLAISTYIYLLNLYNRDKINHEKSSNMFMTLIESQIARSLDGHGQRVGFISREILEILHYPKNKRAQVEQAALIHDIGKALLPSYIFNKKGAFTISEEKEYQSHPQKGAELLRSIPNYDIKMVTWISNHHERWDGKGFPRGLKEYEIPYESRVIALCNHLDHLLMQHSEVYKIHEALQKMSGKELDPSIVGKITFETIQSLFMGNYVYTVAATTENKAIDFEEHRSSLFSLGGSNQLLYFNKEGILRGNAENLPVNEVQMLAKDAFSQRKNFTEIFEKNGQFHELYGHFHSIHDHVFDTSEGVLIVDRDITEFVKYKLEMESKIITSYQEIVAIFSQDTIKLYITLEGLESELGQFVDKIEVLHPEDLSKMRSFVAPYLRQFNPKNEIRIQLAINEAATNMLKHAIGGEVILYKKENGIQILVKDNGSGIPLHEIPKALLISGYSSKRSLGSGFSIMSKSIQKIGVHTSSKGTTLMLNVSFEQS